MRKMKYPGQKRGDGCYGVIQIIITNHCDIGQCSNCTQLICHQRNRFCMKLDNVKRAIDSLIDYPGVIGIFGGNPCIHPQFKEITAYMKERIPDKKRRGLWTNNFRGYGKIIVDTYGYMNLNVHTNKEAQMEMAEHIDPATPIWGTTPSHHAPVLVSPIDFGIEESQRYDLIANCDVNQRWSPAVTEHDGELFCYLCEVGAAFAGMTEETQYGMPFTPTWWKHPVIDFQDQLCFCHNCGVPLKMKGHNDVEFVDDISRSYQMVGNRRQKRVVHTSLDSTIDEATDYQGLRHKQ